jgi:GT2 family glycosyltransferase
MTEPILDIVMLVSNQPTWASIAIHAVEQHTTVPYRLIIVDQATTDERFAEVLGSARSRGHTVIRMAENRSFSNGNNAGVSVGKAKFICILNDDTCVTDGWAEALIQDLSDKSIGLVGARTNYANGPTADPGWNSKVEPPFMAFVCVATRREIWDQVNGLDEANFTGFSAEDFDLCWRIQKAGYKLKVSERAYVLHAGSRSIMHHTSGGSSDQAARQTTYAAHNVKYWRVLEEKWGKDFIAEHMKLRQKVLIVSYHAEEWTRVKFAGSLFTLRAGAAAAQAGYGPEASNYGFTYYQHTRTPIHLARQLVCDYACDNGFDVLIQLDDDAADFPSDLIARFLSHGKDVVTALAYQRKPPYLPCIYELVSKDSVNGNPLLGWERTGLRRVDISGFHCSMIKMSVIKKLRAAGVRDYWGGFDLKCGEDFALSHHLRKIGVPLFVDTDLIVGHIASGPVIDENYKRAFDAGRAQ